MRLIHRSSESCTSRVLPLTLPTAIAADPFPPPTAVGCTTACVEATRALRSSSAGAKVSRLPPPCVLFSNRICLGSESMELQSMPAEKRLLFSTFPMFVPSLSW